MINDDLAKGFIERVWWLIKLRWVAIAGVIATTLFIRHIIKLPLYIPPLYIVVSVLFIYNLIFIFLLYYVNKNNPPNLFLIINRIANAQIVLDLACLATLIHFSGGVENPFIFYFIFHMIIASILLSRRAAFLQASFAVSLFCFIVIGEYVKFLKHYCLEGFITSTLHDNFLYIASVSFVFISTVYIAVYMTTSISSRLREREKHLKEANELLMEKDRIKSEYVLRVSHDIKEHLAAIQFCIEPVTAGITGSLNEKQTELLHRADERTGKLLFFVKALLEITRIKLRKEIPRDYFSLKDIVNEAIEHVIIRAKDKHISIQSSIHPTIGKIRGAKEYIQETINHLLANSVKYTPPHGKIDITVGDKGNTIHVRIIDTGIGIPQDALPRIFEEFYRAPNAEKVERNGTGLGLSIAKQVIERHNGTIWVESEEGRGTTFNIILPK